MQSKSCCSCNNKCNDKEDLIEVAEFYFSYESNTIFYFNTLIYIDFNPN